ncbi:MAG: hypothetical protein L3J84_03060 [Gammaproteobacteria bacterium]|nr:hypothetical protein [Gammaproteobacteria bacterium]
MHNGQPQAWILEVAARTIGGQCAQLLKQGSGYGLEELVIAQTIGKPLPIQNAGSAAGVLMIPILKAGILRRVEGLPAARKISYIIDVEIYMREAHARLNFVTTPVWKVS